MLGGWGGRGEGSYNLISGILVPDVGRMGRKGRRIIQPNLRNPCPWCWEDGEEGEKDHTTWSQESLSLMLGGWGGRGEGSFNLISGILVPDVGRVGRKGRRIIQPDLRNPCPWCWEDGEEGEKDHTTWSQESLSLMLGGWGGRGEGSYNLISGILVPDVGRVGRKGRRIIQPNLRNPCPWCWEGGEEGEKDHTTWSQESLSLMLGGWGGRGEGSFNLISGILVPDVGRMGRKGRRIIQPDLRNPCPWCWEDGEVGEKDHTTWSQESLSLMLGGWGGRGEGSYNLISGILVPDVGRIGRKGRRIIQPDLRNPCPWCWEDGEEGEKDHTTWSKESLSLMLGGWGGRGEGSYNLISGILVPDVGRIGRKGRRIIQPDLRNPCPWCWEYGEEGEKDHTTWSQESLSLMLGGWGGRGEGSYNLISGILVPDVGRMGRKGRRIIQPDLRNPCPWCWEDGEEGEKDHTTENKRQKGKAYNWHLLVLWLVS